jgi:hypothetical protein
MVDVICGFLYLILTWWKIVQVSKRFQKLAPMNFSHSKVAFKGNLGEQVALIDTSMAL